MTRAPRRNHNEYLARRTVYRYAPHARLNVMYRGHIMIIRIYVHGSKAAAVIEKADIYLHGSGR